MKSREIRSAFTGFFAERGHEHLPSGPLVPQNDPTLMFANAGMVQFKDLFTGKERRGYQRATTSQKCIRISGKHNDLENVGRTARHHTFFEMLGNFSFGDYFKREAIELAWELYTKVLKLEPERMVFTVFEGEDGLAPRDEESAKIWKDVTGCDDDRIKYCNAKENFWQMGDTGPCGPCSEIHYCLGIDNVDPSTFGEEPTQEGRGWFELWNLVFMQFERENKDTPLKSLPAPSVDTGAGLERAAVVLQGVLSNYDTDLLRPIVNLASEISGKRYTAGAAEDDVSMRVIADHARTTAFLISEGIFPDKDRREYVLRRVMRRAIRHGYRLGIEQPFLHVCADKVVELMGEDYPQLVERRALIKDIAEDEEKRFRRTLKEGLDLLDKNDKWDTSEGAKTLPGEIAFRLYDTFGFPVDLQEVIGEEQGWVVDQPGFDSELEKAKERSKGSVLNKSQATQEVFFDIKEQHGSTEFTGYDSQQGQSEILAVLSEGKLAEEIKPPPETLSDAVVAPYAVITRSTPFYGEKGGQVGDRGKIVVRDAMFIVQDTQIPVDGLVVHQGYVQMGRLHAGQEATLEVDDKSRSATRRNHSATHLMHWALREVLGPTATQKGSLVGPKRLRFDYAATKPLSEKQIRKIEDLVNEAVLANTGITTEVMSMDAAKAAGAIGIFEEKYGDVVRVLRIGPSLELCGGTHAARTGDIGMFKILSDGGLAAGVRRIEAATGLNALTHLRSVEQELEAAAGVLKTRPGQVVEKMQRLLQDQKALQKELDKTRKSLMSGGAAKDLSADAKNINGVNVLGTTVPVGDGKTLREMADQLRDKLAPAVVLLGAPSQDGKKALLVCSVSKEVTDRFRAGDIVKKAAAVVGGGGGGRPDFAQAGGSDPSKLSEAVATVYG